MPNGRQSGVLPVAPVIRRFPEDARAVACALEDRTGERRMPFAADWPGPIVQKIVVGRRLRGLRERSQLSREQAAGIIKGSAPKISRLELGQATFKTQEMDALLTRYGVVSGPERDDLLQRALYANGRGWWEAYADVLPDWFQRYVGLESGASVVRTYENQFIPGLLQTDSYMRAVAGVGRTSRIAQQAERRVASRHERQKILARPGVSLWAVIDEAALRRTIGGRKVMRQQLEHLRRMSEGGSDVTIQVVTFAIGWHPAQAGPFTILRFAESELPDFVYLEQLTRARLVDGREEVEKYRIAFDDLCVAAPVPGDSPDIILKIMKDL